MRIVFVNHEINLGGGELMLLRFFRGYDRNKFQITLIVPSGGRLAEEADRLGIDVGYADIADRLLNVRRKSSTFRPSNLVKFRDAVRSLRDKIISIKPDAVVSNSLKAHVIAGIAMRKSAIPFGWRLHDIIDGQNFGYMQRRFLLRIADGCPDSISAVSNAAAKPLFDYGLRPERLIVQYNGIETYPEVNGAEIESFRRSLGLTADHFVVTLPGRLIPSKGHEILIEAAKGAVRNSPHVRFLFVGESFDPASGYEKKLAGLIGQSGLRDYFHFLGFHTEMPIIYGVSDAVIQPSQLPDSLPTVILEAMGAGKIVIAADLGGAGEIIDDGVDGFLIRPSDPVRLKNALDRIAARPQSLEPMKKRARDKIRSKFSLDRYICRIEDWLSTLSGCRKRS